MKKYTLECIVKFIPSNKDKYTFYIYVENYLRMFFEYFNITKGAFSKLLKDDKLYFGDVTDI